MFLGASMYWVVTCGLYVAVYNVVSAATFTCPSLFDWHEHEADCSKFYRCIWGKAQSFTCASGTFWSQKLLTCDFQHHVKCQTGSSSDSSLHSHSKSQSNIQSQGNSETQGGSDTSVNLKNDFQLQHKSLQKASTEEGSYKRALYHVTENKKQVEDDDDKATHPDYRHDHQHDTENTEPRNDDVDLDSNADLTYNHFPLDKKTKTRHHRFHDATEDGDWDYFYQEGKDNEEDSDPRGERQEMDNGYSKLHSLQQFLEEFLSSQNNALPHQPPPRYTVQQQQQHHHQQQQHRDVLAPAAAAQDNPPASALETARKQLFNDILVSKLLQHSQFSGYMYQPNTLINTDGTYDVLDVQLQTPDSRHSEQFQPYRSGQFEPYRSGQLTSTDPWSMADLFRAGYGYKRIFQDK